MPDQTNEILVWWNAIAMRERIAQSRDVDPTQFPRSPWVVKTVLITCVRDIITVLVAQNCDFIGNPTKGNNFPPVNVDGRLDTSVRLLDEKVVARSNDRDCINASFVQISDDFETTSGVDLNTKFLRQFCRFFFFFLRCYDITHNRFSRSREREIYEAEE